MTEAALALIGPAVLGIVLAVVLALALIRRVVGPARWAGLVERCGSAPRLFVAHRREVRALSHPSGVPIERVAEHIRRLRRLMATDEHSSAAHQLGNRLAYDRLLMQACEMLSIDHELDGQSTGFERDIERLRVEAELERAGVVLSERGYGQAA